MNYGLQKFDCNCNDCKFMTRDAEKRKASIAFAKPYKQLIHYGYCSKKDKPVSFIPSTIQIDTQDCFLHRKEEK